MSLENLKETQKKSITVGFMYEANKERLALTMTNGEVGFGHEVRDRSIHRPGLALAGYVDLFTFDRVQVFGNTEIRYLQHLPLVERIKSFETIFRFDMPCIIVTNANTIDKELVKIATEHKVSIFTTR